MRRTTPTGREILLGAQSEADWQTQVLRWARQGGWCGIHLRKSIDPKSRYAVVQGVHEAYLRDDHQDQAGFPDWLFVHPRHGVIYVELKTNTGKETAAQRRWLDLLEAAGETARVWRPDDFENVRRILTGP